MKPQDTKVISIDRSLYHHKYKGRVKTFEVDRQNIVHNVIYLYWLEEARVEYFRALGLDMNERTFIDSYRFVVVKTEINYHAPALFDKEYEVLTKISSIGTSSFVFDQAICLIPEETILITAQSVLVQLDPITNQSTPIDKVYRELVNEFEQIHSA
jgi:acyl-CoA thioester hydrolase